MDIPTQVYIQPIFTAVHIHLLIILLGVAYTCVYDASNLSQHFHQTMELGRAMIAFSMKSMNCPNNSLGNDDMIISYSH